MGRRDEFAKVDAHHHIWDLKNHVYPWLQEGPPRQRVYGDSAPLRTDYLLSDYLCDLQGFRFVKSVYLQCGYDPGNPVGETRYVQSVADRDPNGFPHAIVAHYDLPKQKGLTGTLTSVSSDGTTVATISIPSSPCSSSASMCIVQNSTSSPDNE